jgi:putative protease
VKTAELLAPAGSPEALDAAFGEGADGVYLGLKNFNARLRSANFAYSQFEGALRGAHRMGRKIYVTLNTVFEQREADRIFQLLKYLAAVGPDGVIVQDFGIIKMAREQFPSLKLHASTQMNISSGRGANFLSKQGVSRVVLSRELALEEIRGIREETNLELEVFVHGALCISASGLCLFSSFLGGKSANRGMCTQACRRRYTAGMSGSGEPPRGGYFFSPPDLQLLEHIPALVEAGVNAFKIEGRMKSAEYVGTVVSAYRRVIDGLGGDIEKNVREGLGILQNDFARTKTAFYFNRSSAPPAPAPIDAPAGGAEDKGAVLPDAAAGTAGAAWLNPDQDGGTGISLGTLLKVKDSGGGRRGLILPGAVLPRTGDSVRLHRSDDSDRRAHKLDFSEPAGTGKHYWISVPEGFNAGDSVYLIQTRSMSKRYAPVIPKNLESFRRQPGREKAPGADFPAETKTAKKPGFPEGIYAAVSEIEDLYVLQSVRPVRVMLSYKRRTAARLLGSGAKTLPFNPEEMILALDPWFPQETEAALEEDIPRLLDRGYRRFVVNNPGHFSYFRGGARSADGPSLIAGPYFYAFNSWSAAFIAAQGPEAIVSPLENNRQNLERTFPRAGGFPGRRGVFITVFAYPPLFRIRADLSAHGFKDFSGGRNERFKLISRPEGSLVIPETPFSIVDKIPFLKEAGFGRFIADLSGPPLKKKDYKALMGAVENALPLAGTSRFNWKDGFYAVPEGKASDPAAYPAGR